MMWQSEWQTQSPPVGGCRNMKTRARSKVSHCSHDSFADFTSVHSPNRGVGSSSRCL